ncbi:ABC transporter permease [Neorhizobium galegae]|uniref:Taurine transport system permease protein TauC n=1 Tax=Neorhizobium galegae bv. officinalis TaxID=323656 RepID=A0A0T7H4L6_NEOGA|nr:ABC transporter permease [Neorhizobium galegae]CDZ54387.1 Taurine transport system permease protein TauC [Neorhizobium galegae bv. officinalis]
MSSTDVAQTPAATQKAGLAGRLPSWLLNVLPGALSVVAGIVIWQLMSQRVAPLFLPSPYDTALALIELSADGTLQVSVAASAYRILFGWIAGVGVGIPLGIFMGMLPVVRRVFDPYIEFFRFIPPIAFVTLSVIWLGPGETSKIALIFYTTVFIVTLNTIAGAKATLEMRLQAASALGANRWQILTTIVVPSTVPYMVTGARIAMGNSFLTIVSAEIVAAQEGLGALIWNARNFGRTDWVFAGIIVLGLLGLCFDRILRYGTTKFLHRYQIRH